MATDEAIPEPARPAQLERELARLRPLAHAALAERERRQQLERELVVQEHRELELRAALVDAEAQRDVAQQGYADAMRHIDEIKASRTWRIGWALGAPLRLVRRPGDLG